VRCNHIGTVRVKREQRAAIVEHESAARHLSLINIVLNGSSRIVVEGTPDIYRMTPFARC
jgi:hypothetical protein